MVLDDLVTTVERSECGICAVTQGECVVAVQCTESRHHFRIVVRTYRQNVFPVLTFGSELTQKYLPSNSFKLRCGLPVSIVEFVSFRRS